MAITITQKPDPFMPVGNPIAVSASTNVSSVCSHRFELDIMDSSGSTIKTLSMRPSPTGKVTFRIERVLQSLCTTTPYDPVLQISGTKFQRNRSYNYRLRIREMWDTSLDCQGEPTTQDSKEITRTWIEDGDTKTTAIWTAWTATLERDQWFKLRNQGPYEHTWPLWISVQGAEDIWTNRTFLNDFSNGHTVKLTPGSSFPVSWLTGAGGIETQITGFGLSFFDYNGDEVDTVIITATGSGMGSTPGLYECDMGPAGLRRMGYQSSLIKADVAGYYFWLRWSDGLHVSKKVKVELDWESGASPQLFWLSRTGAYETLRVNLSETRSSTSSNWMPLSTQDSTGVSDPEIPVQLAMWTDPNITLSASALVPKRIWETIKGVSDTPRIFIRPAQDCFTWGSTQSQGGIWKLNINSCLPSSWDNLPPWMNVGDSTLYVSGTGTDWLIVGDNDTEVKTCQYWNPSNPTEFWIDKDMGMKGRGWRKDSSITLIDIPVTLDSFQWTERGYRKGMTAVLRRYEPSQGGFLK